MSVRDEAFQDWQKGMKYREIAEKYGVSESTVKSWAARYFKPKVATDGKKKLQPSGAKAAKKRGAPFGNKNAVGNHGGPPPGSANHYRHGFYYDALSPDEQAFIDAHGELTQEQRLLNELDLWEIKERRLMRELKELRESAPSMVPQSIVKNGGNTSATVVNKKEYIIRLENLLTQAQKGHMRCIMGLSRIGIETEKLQLAKARMSEFQECEDMNDIERDIYGDDEE